MSEDPKQKPTPTIHPDGDTVVSVRDLLTMQDRIGERAIRDALDSGAMPSRMIGGSVGRVTTWSAFLRWVEGYDARATAPRQPTDGVDG